jgi:hypothetical protein
MIMSAMIMSPQLQLIFTKFNDSNNGYSEVVCCGIEKIFNVKDFQEAKKEAWNIASRKGYDNLRSITLCGGAVPEDCQEFFYYTTVCGFVLNTCEVYSAGYYYTTIIDIEDMIKYKAMTLENE